MVTLYLDSSTACGFFLSWQAGPPQDQDQIIWDCVESYAMHTFCNLSVDSPFKSFQTVNLKLIIFVQRVSSSVLPPVTEEAPLFVCLACLHSRMLRTIRIQNPIHVKQRVLQMPKFFCTRPSNQSYVQKKHKQEFFGTKNFCALWLFKATI